MHERNGFRVLKRKLFSTFGKNFFEMEKIISYPISAIAILLFLLGLIIFHPIQWICFNLFGYQAHKKSVDYLNLYLLRITLILGTTYKIENRVSIPENVPLIFVANQILKGFLVYCFLEYIEQRNFAWQALPQNIRQFQPFGE